MKRSTFTRDDVEVLNDKSVYDGFFKVRELQLRHRKFDGSWSPTLRRELVLRHDAVGVLLYDPHRDEIALVEQFRVGAMKRNSNPWLLELVAGLIDSDEDTEQVARREAIEEAGCAVSEMELICEYFSSPGGNNEYFYLYCGHCDLQNAGGVFGLPEEGEDIRVHVLAVDDAMQRLQRGEMHNAHTIIALQWLQLHRQRLREQWR
jgi:ADP-ribose pyrophosphatase